jgi:hypothetical protein
VDNNRDSEVAEKQNGNACRSQGATEVHFVQLLGLKADRLFGGTTVPEIRNKSHSFFVFLIVFFIQAKAQNA